MRANEKITAAMLKDGQTVGDSVYIQRDGNPRGHGGYCVTQLNHLYGVKRYYFTNLKDAVKRYHELCRWPDGYGDYNSWDDWNVALWLADNEPEYRRAMEIYNGHLKTITDRRPGERAENLKRHAIIRAANTLYICYYRNERTPDGARYTEERLRLAVEAIVD